MVCLKRADGRVVATLWKGGGITVKLVDEGARAEGRMPRQLGAWRQYSQFST